MPPLDCRMVVCGAVVDDHEVITFRQNVRFNLLQELRVQLMPVAPVAPCKHVPALTLGRKNLIRSSAGIVI